MSFVTEVLLSSHSALYFASSNDGRGDSSLTAIAVDCGVEVREVGWEGFQPVCGWCLRIVDERGMEVAREAWREGEGWEGLRRGSAGS